jgi:Na+/proline symporter
LIRTAIAALVFAVLYGTGIRLYAYLRAGRDTHRWQVLAVAVASAMGGMGFYAAQQVRSPRPPTLLDIPAFVIMAVAAGVIPAILETTRVLQVRLLRDARVEVPQRPRLPPDNP